MKQRANLWQMFEPKIIIFLTAGIVNTIFGYAVYAVLLFVGTSYLIALLLATIAGVIFNYFSFGRFVFHRHSGWLVFCRFVVTYAAIYGFNAAGLTVLTRDFLVSPYIGQVICIPPSVLLSWLLMNYWVFRK